MSLHDPGIDSAAAVPALTAASHTDSRSSFQIDAALLRRIEANMAWLLATAAPHCTSEPESYGLADAASAHADLAAILASPAAGSRLASG